MYNFKKSEIYFSIVSINEVQIQDENFTSAYILSMLSFMLFQNNKFTVSRTLLFTSQNIWLPKIKKLLLSAQHS